MSYRDLALVPVAPECTVGALCEHHRRLARAFNMLLKDYNLLKEHTRNYGIIYVSAGSTAQTGIDDTPVVLEGFTTAGPTSGVTADTSAGTLTVDIAGIYSVAFQLSFQGDAADTYVFEIYVNDVATGYRDSTKPAGSDVGSVSVTALLSLSADDVVSMYVVSDDVGGSSCTPVDMQLRINYQSGVGQ